MAVQSGWWLVKSNNAAVRVFLCLADGAAANQRQAPLMKITQAGARDVNREQERAGRERHT